MPTPKSPTEPTTTNNKLRSRKVPSSRVARLVNFGGLASSLAGNVLASTTKQMLSGKAPSLSQSLREPKNASSIANKLSKMRGAAMKLGQLLSMDAGDFLPHEWEPILAKLRENADSMPKQQLLSMLKQAWGDNWQDKFQYFSFEPIAAASIGQVHRATLKDGTELAVKVQYPGIKQSIDSDVDNLASLVKLSGSLPKHVNLQPLLTKAKQQLHEEADYSLEAERLQRYAEKLTPMSGQNEVFSIPRVYQELTTSTVLSMEFMSGVPINSVTAPEHKAFIVHHLLALTLAEIFSLKLTQSDPNFANFLYDPTQQKIHLLDFGATRDIPEQTSHTFLQLAKAMQEGSAPDIERCLLNLGLIDSHMPISIIGVIVNACILAGECLQHDSYNFAQKNLLKRLYSTTQPLVANKVTVVEPEFDVALINRKVTGIILLANKMGVAVNLRSLLAQYLG